MVNGKNGAKGTGVRLDLAKANGLLAAKLLGCPGVRDQQCLLATMYRARQASVVGVLVRVAPAMARR